ncbi:unnamed protein product [Allacma fusca]|uniref:non-specific serine/threonine protein kinase n=1 Tax=Allacma fusca TaxID=39272 RepID=A0A8J2LPF2_9HEXA|nr:unnamed protein product [Allacma fusca]
MVQCERLRPVAIGQSAFIVPMAEPNKIHFPQFFPEPQSLSSKKDRDKRNPRYVPPAPRPHHIRSAPTQTRLIHSRSDFLDLDNSFHFLHDRGNGTTQTFFRQFFEIQERLGFGSFGDVFRVKSKLDGAEYAIKKSRKTYTGEGDRSRQLREVQRVVNIPTNLHLVELERAWEEDGHLYLQMELCLKSLNLDIEDSETRNALRSSEKEAWNVLVDMLLALQHLHKHSLVHMDVKPDNIFLTRDVPPVYKLGDFGIVVCLEEQQDILEFTDGDSRYLAPEVMQGYVSTKADVFSLGLTILEVACHVDLPKGGELWHRLRAGGDLPDPCDKLVPKSLKRVLQLMLQPDPSERPEVTELLNLPEVKKHWRRRKKDNVDKSTSVMEFRATPEPYVTEGNSAAVPDLLLNDTSFSDIDDDPTSSQTSTPIFASTPISHSKAKSAVRLRSGRTSRQGHDGEIRPMGSPTSRNLLKEFEAVSE